MDEVAGRRDGHPNRRPVPICRNIDRQTASEDRVTKAACARRPLVAATCASVGIRGRGPWECPPHSRCSCLQARAPTVGASLTTRSARSVGRSFPLFDHLDDKALHLTTPNQMLEPVFGPLLVSKHDATTAPSHAMPYMGLARMPMRMPPVLVWCCWCRARSQAPRCRVASSGLSDFIQVYLVYPGFIELLSNFIVFLVSSFGGSVLVVVLVCFGSCW